jgi:hypothetical protein
MSRPTITLATITLATIANFATACDQRRLAATGDVQADHSEDRASVIGTDSNGTSIRGSTDPLTGNDCIIIGDDCLAPEAAGDFCERDGGPYDIIVVDGEVVDVICYPPADDGQTTVVDGDGDIAVPQNENNTTVTFDDATDGTPIEGDLVIDGNNVAVYGNGIDETVILGNVILDGNNVRLRGLTIDGNLTVPKNNLAMLFVKGTGCPQVLDLGLGDDQLVGLRPLNVLPPEHASDAEMPYRLPTARTRCCRQLRLLRYRVGRMSRRWVDWCLSCVPPMP